MDTRQPINASAMSIMTVLCILWGLQQVVLKATASDLGPVLHIALRSGIAALLTISLMLWRSERLNFVLYGKAGLVAGSLFALEFIFLGTALHYTTASHSVVLLYTAPIFAAIGLQWKLPSERLRRLQWVGISLAFIGVVVTFWGGNPNNPATQTSTQQALFGDFLALLAGLCWAATTVVIRTTALSKAPATETLLYQLLIACFILLLAAWFLGDFYFRSTPLVWSGLLFQSVMISFASFLIWFGLLKRYLASQLGVFSFLTPLFGIVFGVLLLNDPIETRFIIGSALVLAGIILVSGHTWFMQIMTSPRKSS
ncbi:DMT family transporter [Thiolinea disciformis]|uniref:DMT family transporter n=1 Tax=Thiolinea disciformis TaxID=125614 RepID=UPI00036D112D|nr:DMT family transporter [Thiolinea disciformis]